MRRLIDRTASRGRRKSRGQVLAEFTIVIPLFLLIFLGIAEGGYYVAATTIVNNATHEGARLGVLRATGSRGTVRTRVMQSAASIVSLDNTQINLKLAAIQEDGTYPGLVDCNNTCYQDRKKDDRLVVTTSYTHIPLVGYVFSGISFPANAQAELVVEEDAA